MDRTDSSYRLYLTIVITVVMLGLGLFSAASPQAAPRYEKRMCFSAKLWSADLGDRPCYTIGRPQEDGSGSFWVHAARSENWTWYCSVPNPNEVPKYAPRMTVECTRVTGWDR